MVTLVAVSSVRIRQTIAALRISARDINFGDALLITHRRPRLLPAGIRVELTDELSSIDQYNHFIIYDLHKYVSTEYALVVQADGYVINAKAWTDEFLQYDYIGAPWPLKNDAYMDPFGTRQRVGNGGFSLRSRRLLLVPEEHEVTWDVNQGNFYKHMNAGLTSEDGNICVHNRHIYEGAGCRFAPIQVAAEFSTEVDIPGVSNPHSFGFHKKLPGRLRKHFAPYWSGFPFFP